MVDDRKTGDRSAQPQGPPEDVTRVIHELAEALTALGNFIAAAARISDGADPPETDIHKVLEGASGQHERAATALHRLRSLLMHQKP